MVQTFIIKDLATHLKMYLHMYDLSAAFPWKAGAGQILGASGVLKCKLAGPSKYKSSRWLFDLHSTETIPLFTQKGKHWLTSSMKTHMYGIPRITLLIQGGCSAKNPSFYVIIQWIYVTSHLSEHVNYSSSIASKQHWKNSEVGWIRSLCWASTDSCLENDKSLSQQSHCSWLHHKCSLWKQ